MLIKWSLAGALVAILLVGAYVWTNLPKPAVTPIGQPNFVESERGHKIAFYASGNGPRVVLLASLGRSGSDFNQLADALKQSGYRTLIIDPPGVGESDRLRISEPTLYDLARDVEAVIAADGTG